MAKTPRAITDMSTLARIVFDIDTIPPSVPSNVVGTPISSTRIDLNWSASTDIGGSGVSSYQVFRNGSQVGTASTVSFSDAGLTALTTYQYRIAAVDGAGNVSAQSTAIGVTTQANQGPPVFAPVQPAAGFIGIAGVRAYTDATQQAAIGRYNLFVLGATWEGWATSGRDIDTIAKAIKTAAVAPGGVVLLNYQNLNGIQQDANDAYPTYTAGCLNPDWRLYVSGSSGALVTPPAGSTNTALINYTDFVPVNSSLEHPYDFGAKYSFYKFLTKSKSDARFTGLGAGLASTSIDGVYQDNWLLNPEANGDWNRDGTTEGQGWPSTPTPWLAAGQLRYVNTMRSLAPTKYVFANAGDYGVTDAGVMVGKLDGMLIESYFGKNFSWDTQSGFVTTRGYYYRALNSAANPRMVVVGGCWPDTDSQGGALPRLPTSNGFPPLNTQWQWARYIASFAYLGEGMPAINRLSQGYSSDLTALDWYDFFGGITGLARGWLGAPVDALRPTTAKIAKGPIGIFGVEYANGIVLCNPVANGTQTVVAADIPGTWKFLTGTQDPVRDSGAQFVSLALPERDGLILQRGGSTLSITTGTPLPSATQGSPYTTTFAATGGTPPYTWSIQSASPNTGSWFSLNASTGVGSGTPGTLETESIVIKVTDSATRTASKTFALTVSSSTSPGYTPWYKNTWAPTGTVGSVANTIINNTGIQQMFVADPAAEFGGTGPFGETRITKVSTIHTDATETFFGGTLLNSTVALNPGDETWIRIFHYFPSSFCAGTDNTAADYGDGSIKWLRYQFASNNSCRLTFKVGGMGFNSCASASNAPNMQGMAAEVMASGTNNNYVSNRVVIPRDRWVALQWHMVHGKTVATSLLEMWIDNTYLGTAQILCSQYPNVSSDSILIVMGDYWNGGSHDGNKWYVSNAVFTKQRPTTLDSGGRPYISPTQRITDFP